MSETILANEFNDSSGFSFNDKGEISTSGEWNNVNEDDNDISSISATIVLEFYPFEPIAANDRLGSESDLNEDPGEVICSLANTTRYVYES